MPEICIVDYGSHIGEYSKQKITASGRSLKWVAEQLNTSRENFYKSWLGKAEWLPSQVTQLTAVLGENFFDEFFEKNPDLRGYQPRQKDPAAPEHSIPEEALKHEGSGYSISIEIDPVNFDPDYMKPLSESLKKALEEFRRRIEKDNT